MGYREVTMIEIKEVLRQWLAGVAKKKIAARLGSDPKTVRRYIQAAQDKGIERGTTAEVTDEMVSAVQVELHRRRDREHGESWARCEEQKEPIEKWLKNGVRLSKIRRLLHRSGIAVPYSTLHRFAVAELEFGRGRATVPIVDGKPGEEVQLDTGWVLSLKPDETGKRRRTRAWIFTPNVSRYRFIYPCFAETTQTAIAACEAAWEFYGGVFRVVIPDNTKTIIHKADPLQPNVTLEFLEYAQKRGFHVDPTRAGHPKDKARVEKTVRDVRDDCFGGERLLTVEDAAGHARRWCADDYGMRRHSSTYRLPREHFEAEEKPCLLPAPEAPYDIPEWGEPKVGRDHLAQIVSSFYTLPTEFIGKRVRARADRCLVRFYYKGALVKTHPRKAPGQKSIDPSDFPDEKTPYAMRDIVYLEQRAKEHGEAVGKYAAELLAGPLPWTKMRRVRALIRLAEKYGDARVVEACTLALSVDMIDVRRLERMLQIPPPRPPERPPAKVIPIARYLRPPVQYALPLVPPKPHDEGDPA